MTDLDRVAIDTLFSGYRCTNAAQLALRMLEAAEGDVGASRAALERADERLHHNWPYTPRPSPGFTHLSVCLGAPA